MSSQHKPTDYSTVSPYLIVSGADATISFLSQVFGATTLRRITHESGKVMHAEVRIDDTVIMLTDEFPPGWPAVAWRHDMVDRHKGRMKPRQDL